MEGDDEKDVLLKLQQYLNNIPPGNLDRLDSCITSEEELCHIAEKLANWESKYYLLGLEYHEIKDIKSQQDNPVVQRRGVLQMWKDRVGIDCTYRNLLKICAKGEWHDSAMVIVNLLKKFVGAAVSADEIQTAEAEDVSGENLSTHDSASYGAEAEASADTVGKPKESRSAALSQSIMKLELRFSDLAESLLSHLKSFGICVGKLTSLISLLPRSINVYVFPMWKKICKRINSDETLDSLFATLNMEIWNILDYNLLEYFVKRLGNRDLKRRMNGYISKLVRFKKDTLVMEFIECWEGHNRDIPDYEEVKFEFDEGSLTLADLDGFRKKLMRKYFPSLLNFAGWMYYKHFKKGCFIVSLLLPEQLAILLKEHINSTCMLLEEYQVKEVMLREMIIYNNSHKALDRGRASSLPNVSSIHATQCDLIKGPNKVSSFSLINVGAPSFHITGQSTQMIYFIEDFSSLNLFESESDLEEPLPSLSADKSPSLSRASGFEKLPQNPRRFTSGFEDFLRSPRQLFDLAVPLPKPSLVTLPRLSRLSLSRRLSLLSSSSDSDSEPDTSPRLSRLSLLQRLSLLSRSCYSDSEPDTSPRLSQEFGKPEVVFSSTPRSLSLSRTSTSVSCDSFMEPDTSTRLSPLPFLGEGTSVTSASSVLQETSGEERRRTSYSEQSGYGEPMWIRKLFDLAVPLPKPSPVTLPRLSQALDLAKPLPKPAPVTLPRLSRRRKGSYSDQASSYSGFGRLRLGSPRPREEAVSTPSCPRKDPFEIYARKRERRRSLCKQPSKIYDPSKPKEQTDEEDSYL